MDENASEVQTSYRHFLKIIEEEQLLQKNQGLEAKISVMTIALAKLKYAAQEALALPSSPEVVLFIKDIEYDFGRIHRERAYALREKLRGDEARYFEHFAAFIESAYCSGKPLSHFCLIKGELIKWSLLPRNPLSPQPQISFAATNKELKLYWELLKKLLVIFFRRG